MNSLNHSSANCRQDPANGFKQKGSHANQASLKAAFRDVLNEPPDTNRSRDMDSEDSEKAVRRKNRGKK